MPYTSVTADPQRMALRSNSYLRPHIHAPEPQIPSIVSEAPSPSQSPSLGRLLQSEIAITSLPSSVPSAFMDHALGCQMRPHPAAQPLHWSPRRRRLSLSTYNEPFSLAAVGPLSICPSWPRQADTRTCIPDPTTGLGLAR